MNRSAVALAARNRAQALTAANRAVTNAETRLTRRVAGWKLARAYGRDSRFRR